MATVELIPPPEPEKQVVIRLDQREAARLMAILNTNEGYRNAVGEGGTTLYSVLHAAGLMYR